MRVLYHPRQCSSLGATTTTTATSRASTSTVRKGNSNDDDDDASNEERIKPKRPSCKSTTYNNDDDDSFFPMPDGDEEDDDDDNDDDNDDGNYYECTTPNTKFNFFNFDFEYSHKLFKLLPMKNILIGVDPTVLIDVAILPYEMHDNKRHSSILLDKKNDGN